jgi:hypothetical protein
MRSFLQRAWQMQLVYEVGPQPKTVPRYSVDISSTEASDGADGESEPAWLLGQLGPKRRLLALLAPGKAESRSYWSYRSSTAHRFFFEEGSSSSSRGGGATRSAWRAGGNLQLAPHRGPLPDRGGKPAPACAHLPGWLGRWNQRSKALVLRVSTESSGRSHCGLAMGGCAASARIITLPSLPAAALSSPGPVVSRQAWLPLRQAPAENWRSGILAATACSASQGSPVV